MLRTKKRRKKTLSELFCQIDLDPPPLTKFPGSAHVIKGLTDKGQFQYLTKVKGPQEGLPVNNTISFIKIKINNLSENT